MSFIIKHSDNLKTQAAKLLTLASERDILPLSAIREAGVHSIVASRLVREGRLDRVARGLYRHPDAAIGEYQDLVEVFAKTKKAVVVLLSALRFHEIGTQQPHEVWIQLPARARIPSIEWPSLRIIRTRIDTLFYEGVNKHLIGGIDIPITNPARTVADCFKHRNTIGLDICLEALKELLRRNRNVMDELHYYAKLNRVQRVMQPYIEATA